jgi:hypothetical protein
MKRLIAPLLILFFLPLSALGQEREIVDNQILNPVITGPQDIAVGRTLVLDASASTGLGEDTEYRWYRDSIPQPISNSVEAVYTPERPGESTFRLVIRTTIDDQIREIETSRTITVYNRKIALIADSTVPTEKLELHWQAAVEAGVHLRVLHTSETLLPLAAEEVLTGLITDQSDALTGAEAVVLWTEGITGLQALMRAYEANPEQLQGLSNQAIVLITNRSLQTVSRIARGPFSVLKPDRIMVTRKEALNPLFAASDMEAFLLETEQRDIDLLVVDEKSAGIRPWNLLSSLVNYMLTHGVSSQVIILLLTLPIIATIIAFLKQIIGITTFGLFTPSIIALSFLALGWKVGVLFLILILITGYATRAFMRKWRLLYIPKVAVILTVVTITLLLLIGMSVALNIQLAFSRDTVFILLIMSTMSESFLTLKSEEGWFSAFFGISQTIIAALICVAIVSWTALQSIVLAYPELILLTIFVNLFLGRWTGLRLIEYFRFREVFKHLQEE